MCLLLTLAGCIDVETVVRVKPDGSGAIEERLLVSEELVSLANQMGNPDGNQGSALFKREELETRAGGMGPGVSLASVETLKVGKREGYTAVFAVEDINKLRLNQNPSDRAPSGPGMQSQGPESKDEPLTFRFTPGPTPELIVFSQAGQPPQAQEKTSGEMAGDTLESAADEAGAEMAMAMMQQLFKDLRIALAVEVEGRIVETNATFQEGSRITLMALDFGKLLENAEQFERFAGHSPETLADAKALMKGLPGIKAELSPEVRIRFAGGAAAPAQHRAAASSAPTPPSRTGNFRWRTIKPRQLGQHRLALVRLTDDGGAAHKGMLREVGGGDITLLRAAMDGGGEMRIPVTRIRQVQVFERGP